jgi:hypothetical protein
MLVGEIACSEPIPSFPPPTPRCEAVARCQIRQRVGIFDPHDGRLATVVVLDEPEGLPLHRLLLSSRTGSGGSGSGSGSSSGSGAGSTRRADGNEGTHWAMNPVVS